MKRLHLVVEGHGDVTAAPILARRVIMASNIQGWLVNQRGSRLPRSSFVDETRPSPKRPPMQKGLEQAAGMALAARASAMLLLTDEDDDCAAFFGPPASKALSTRLPAAAVMAVREFETWLVLSRSPTDLEAAGIKNPMRRDAKSALRTLVPGYLPTVHQAELSSVVDVGALRSRSRSFDKFARSIESLCGFEGNR